MSFWGKLAKIALGAGGVVAAPFTGGTSLIPTIAGAAGSALGAIGDAKTANRNAGIDLAAQTELINEARQRDYRNAAAQREQDRRDSGREAFREMQHAQYMASGGAGDYKPRFGSGFGFGPKASTPAEIEAANQYLAEQQRRLAAGDSLLPAVNDPGRFQFDKKLTTPGKLETIAGVGSAIGTGLGALKPHDDPFAGLDSAQRRTVIAALAQLGYPVDGVKK